MCKYCNKETAINLYGNELPGNDGYSAGLHIVFTDNDSTDEKEHFYLYASNCNGFLTAVQINYCPICGRKLE
jgi:hypothetical protein